MGTILGPSPHGVYTYFATTFPKLFMSLYSFACIHLRTDPLLERYFPDNVSSEDMGPFCMNSTTSLMVTIAPGYLHQSQEKLNEMEHPSRPGEDKCEFFIRTGYCRYGMNCRFDHPREFFVQRNSVGLPLRPDAAECDYFMDTGLCKYGMACRFNHSEKYVREGKSGGKNISSRRRSSGEKHHQHRQAEYSSA